MDIKTGKYRHFKGNEYEVLYVAKHSETMEEMVVYRALYGEKGVWVRPAEMWDETITRDGKTFKRFEKIGGGRLKQIDIVLNDFTAKHGVFSITKKVMGSKIHFKGNSRTYYNPQYNIVSNPNYFSTPIEECGTKLSILAK